MSKMKMPLYRTTRLLAALLLGLVGLQAQTPDAGQSLRVGVNWIDPLDPRNRVANKRWDELRIARLPEGMSIEQGLLSCACPTTIADLRSYYRGLSKTPPWPVLIDEERSKVQGFTVPVLFDPVVKLEGIIGYRVGKGVFKLVQGSETIDCHFSEQGVLVSLPEGTRVRIVGVVAVDKLSGALRVAFVLLDPTFTIQDFSAAQEGANGARWLQLLSEPLVVKPVKKATLKDRKEYGDLILQSAKIKDWDTVREAIEEGGLINTRNEADHANALTYALREQMPIEKRRDLVQFLIEHGALPADADSESSSVPTVFLGTQWNDVELVVLLLRGGARPATELFGMNHIKSPIQKARELGNAELVSLLSAVLEATKGEPITTETVGQIRNNQAAQKPARSEGISPSATGNASRPSSEVGAPGASQQARSTKSPKPSDQQAAPDASSEQEPAVPYPSDSILDAFTAVALAKGRLHGISGKDKCFLEVLTVSGDTFTGIYHDFTSGFPFSYTVAGKVSKLEASFTAEEWVEKPSIAAASDPKPGSGCSAELKLGADGLCVGKVRYKTWERSKLTLSLKGNRI